MRVREDIIARTKHKDAWYIKPASKQAVVVLIASPSKRTEKKM